MEERTLAIIKPDAVLRGLIGHIIRHLEEAGLKIVAMKMIEMDINEAKGFYEVHAEESFYEGLSEFMASGPCVVMILEGEDVIMRYRRLMGATNYEEAEPGTIRASFATSIRYNVVHGSDSKESANFEINYFFDEHGGY